MMEGRKEGRKAFIGEVNIEICNIHMHAPGRGKAVNVRGKKYAIVTL